MQRTPEQIANLRNALSVSSPFMRFLPDETINAYADRLQAAIDAVPYVWEVRVRLGTETIPWLSIMPEPVQHRLRTRSEMQAACQDLLAKYKNIHSVRVNIFGTDDDNFVVGRF